MIMKIRQMFCKHDYELCRKVQPFHNLSGEQLYKRCTKCGKVIKDRFVSTEEMWTMYQ
jgi:hypothetical protein